MPYDPDHHHRRSIRLGGYDYASAGAYFITVCTQGHLPRFRDAVNATAGLNGAGEMVVSVWESMVTRYGGIAIHPYVVMPNHFHAIVVLHATIVGAPLVGAIDQNTAPACWSESGAHDSQMVGTIPTPTLGMIVGAFKSLTTRAYMRGVRERGWSPFDRRLWQRNYWEHIIRTPASYAKICEYITNNPANWQTDSLYPTGYACSDARRIP